MSIAVRQSSDAHTQSCGVGLHNARTRLNHVHGVSTLLKGKEAGRVGFHAVIPGGKHGGAARYNRTRSCSVWLLGEHGLKGPRGEPQGAARGDQFLKEGTARRMSHAGKFVKPSP